MRFKSPAPDKRLPLISNEPLNGQAGTNTAFGVGNKITRINILDAAANVGEREGKRLLKYWFYHF